MNRCALICLAGAVLSLAGVARAADAEFRISGDASKGAATFKTYCAACHGDAGKGDGVAAAALNPKPRALNDKAYMDAMTDQHLFDVIKKGGAAVGKSPLMVAWGPVLGDDQKVHDVAAFVRTLAK